jgi:hypothetical protein
MTVNMLAGYNFAFGHSSAPQPPGIGVFGSGAAAQVRSVDLGRARYRLQLFVQAQNLTNEANYLGYSGTLTSPFFGKPTAVKWHAQDRLRHQLRLLIEAQERVVLVLPLGLISQEVRAEGAAVKRRRA